MLVNTLILTVNAHTRIENYFLLEEPTPPTDASELLSPEKTAKTSAPRSPARRAFLIAKWLVLQGAQENVLSFVLWWTFGSGIVHGASCRGAC